MILPCRIISHVPEKRIAIILGETAYFENVTRPAAAGAASPAGRAARKLLLLLGIYFALQCVTRAVVSQNLQNDEAEQVLLAQDWNWGYGAQPPLYTWIQKTVFAVLGTNVFALALVKNAFLFSVYALVFLSAREIFRQDRPAVFAAASLLLFPLIVWESQRDQTHLILATVCSAAALYIFLRLIETRWTGWYILFGVVAGLGALSKYNELFFLVALVIAALSMPAARPAVITPKMALALAALALIVAPHIIWFVHHQSLGLSESHSFGIAAQGTGVTVYIRGIKQLVTATLLFAGPPVLIYVPFLIIARKYRTTATMDPGTGMQFQFLVRVMIIGLLLVAAVVIACRVTVIRERWLEPLCFALPILLAGWARPALERRAANVLLFLAGGAAAASLIAVNGTVLAANALHREHNLNIPWREVAAGLRADGFQGGNIIADGIMLGGNLKMQFRDSRVSLPLEPVPLAPGAPLLLTWPANPRDKPTAGFLAVAERISGQPIRSEDMRYVEVQSANGSQKSERLGFVIAKTIKME